MPLEKSLDKTSEEYVKDDPELCFEGLIKEIDDKFDPEISDIDRCILYEITDFRKESINADKNFWKNYEDYKGPLDFSEDMNM